MNTAQYLAADPKVSAWVNASAGTGKTKVLIDRLLNLLLEGFAPERILCLTFTKAAAQEMSNRLMQRLAQWAIMPLPKLEGELEELYPEENISPHLTIKAKSLFTMVLDAPGGIRIQTIHSFCQAILARFPLEAEISPHFRVLDEAEGEALLREVQRLIFAKPTPAVEAALSILNPYMSDQRFNDILDEFSQYRARVEALVSDEQSLWNLLERLFKFLEVSTYVQHPEEILDLNFIPHLKMKFVPEGVEYDTYKNNFLTQKGEIRKKLSPEQNHVAKSVFKFNQTLLALELIQRTGAFLVLFQAIMESYQDRKIANGALDYEDLIQKTRKLITLPGNASWILYKLDGGIDHLLIDEAQDTNSAQWEIILKLTEDFFTQDKPYRTVFVVGDAKQSIYSFQGASPHEFLRFNAHFSRNAPNWREVELGLSYRSTETILAIVDEVFSKETNRRGMSFLGADIVHNIYREQDPGLVKLWPLMTPLQQESKDDMKWTLPVERIEQVSAQTLLARHIAREIKNWISSQVILPSTREKIQPRDILILVRKRSELVHEIMHALKEQEIPVGGSDRLILADHILVMDLLALGQFSLLPEDDYSLACVLRSPLIGLSEEELYAIAYDREGTLWESLSQNRSINPSFEAAYLWLNACLTKVDFLGVYEFYSWVLKQGEGLRRFLSRLGNEVEDIVEEFLVQALNYDQNYAASLQGFLHFMGHQSQEIKRDASNTVHNKVRIMTVHGAKGLQAPIVILPDAAESGHKKNDLLLWGEDIVMLWPSQAQDTEQTTHLKNIRQEAISEEERRLLYVALTRAQDWLFVGGCAKDADISSDSWYKIIQEALQAKSATSSYQLGNFETKQHYDLVIQEPLPLPEWVTSRPKNITPHKKVREKDILSSAAMDRGILIHKFFEYLPNLSREKRYTTACQFVEKEGLSVREWENDIQEVLKILDSPDFEKLFGENSLAEVSVTAFHNNEHFQGRIDRVLVTEDTLTIVDYKTDSIFPHTLQDVPAAYIKQLEAYEAALKSLYPNHKIKKMILWTAGPILQEIG